MPSVCKDKRADGSLARFWQGKRILLVSPEAWGPVRLSKHHYATTLMECGAEVFFLGPDMDKMDRPGIAQRQGPNAPVLIWRKRPMRGMRFMPRSIRSLMEAQQMETLAEICGGPFDILWNFDLHRFRYLTDRKNARLRMMHAMDLRRSHDLVEPAANADHVFVVSPCMAGALGQDFDHAVVLPHAWMPRKPVAIDMPTLPHGIKVGYLGNLSMRAINWDSICSIAAKHPEVQFYLIGPVEDAFGDHTRIRPAIEQRLQSLPNIRIQGPVPYDEVPQWLEAMDVLLIAYDLERFGLKATSSHKVIEYLASGKVVVSSFLEDHQNSPDLIVMARPGEDIGPYFQQVIDQLEQYNSTELQAQRKTVAESNTYADRVASISKLIRVQQGQ